MKYISKSIYRIAHLLQIPGNQIVSELYKKVAMVVIVGYRND